MSSGSDTAARTPFLLDRAVQRATAGRSFLARVERLFLAGGLVLLAAYLGLVGYGQLSQLYYDWSLDRTLAGQPISIGDFVSDLLREPVSLRAERRPAAPPRRVRRFVHRRVPAGEAVGRLRIPSLRLSVMVLEGTERRTLAKGVGHIEGTAMPGEDGNFAVAGHRDSFFRKLKDITADDQIVLETLDGTFTYKVESTSIVRPTDTQVLDSAERPTLTLVTCYPFYFVGHAPQRFIVRCGLLE